MTFFGNKIDEVKQDCFEGMGSLRADGFFTDGQYDINKRVVRYANGEFSKLFMLIHK